MQNWLRASQKKFIQILSMALPIAHSFPVFILALRKAGKYKWTVGVRMTGAQSSGKVTV